jgi:uncharacterized protein (TIGR02145 family)
MNKANIVRSSEFHADTGDVIHYILIVDSGATPTINLVSLGTTSNEEEVPDAVVALNASDITSSSFTANWNFIENAQSYYLDVSTDIAFGSFVAGYNNLSVGAVNEYPVVGLDDAITYYYRVRGKNDIDTGASSNIITTTTANEVVTDADGNVYTYVTIGTQQWMVENFRSTKYRDGTAIPNLILDAAWTADVTGAYCWYNNDIANKIDYGALYNWYAVDNAHLLAPAGWRIPSETDFNTLNAFLGGLAVAGGKLKEMGLSHWTTPNDGATDDYGFKMLPNGERYGNDGTFHHLTNYSLTWASTEYSLTQGWFYNTSFDNTIVYMSGDGKKFGFSVRMMRDV